MAGYIPIREPDIEYVTIAPADMLDATVIAAIRVAVPQGVAKAKVVGTGTATDPEFCFELSEDDSLTRIRSTDQTGGGTGGADVDEVVSFKASRTTPGPFTGFRSFVGSNQVTYRWDGSAYVIAAASVVGTGTELAAMSELENEQEFIHKELGLTLIYRTDVSPSAWVARTGG